MIPTHRETPFFDVTTPILLGVSLTKTNFVSLCPLWVIREWLTITHEHRRTYVHPRTQTYVIHADSVVVVMRAFIKWPISFSHFIR